MSLIIPAVVISLQTIKVGVHAERIPPVCQNEVGVPVETLHAVLCHTDDTPVRLSVSHIAVSGSYGRGPIVSELR